MLGQIEKVARELSRQRRSEANLSDPAVGVSYARVRHIEMSGRPTGQVTNPTFGPLAPGDLLRANPCTSLIVVRRQVFEEVGLFNERMNRAEDQEWLFRAALGNLQIRGIDRVLASYRITPGSVSSNVEGMLKGHNELLAIAQRLAPKIARRHRRVAHAGMLRYCARRAMDYGTGRVAARSYMLRALATAPVLLVIEPRETLAAVASVFAPGLLRALRGRHTRLTHQAT